MAVTDPNDARLLAALAEQGKVPVHELAARLGMDPRDVAYRLVTLSGAGLPLLVGVECDPQGVRAALAGPRYWQGGPPLGAMPSGPPSGQVPGGAGGPYQQRPGRQSPAAGAPAQQPYPYPAPAPAPAHPAHGTPGPPSGAQPAQSPPSGAQQPRPQPDQSAAPELGSRDAASPDQAISTWGPPQTSSWARGDTR